MEDEYVCRICLEEDSRHRLIAPCACRGSQRWVHRECLDKWRSMREDRAFSRCTECLQSYQLVCLTQDSRCDLCARRTRFCYLVSRDLSVVVLATQLCIAVFALIAWAIDGSSHSFADSFGMEKNLVSFYYLVGLFCSLSLLGLLYFLVRWGCFGDMATNMSTSHSPDLCLCTDNGMLPLYIYTGHPECVCIDCGACHPEICVAGNCGDCCTAACAGLGEELIFLFVALLVLLAFVGVLVCVILGAVVLQSIVVKHVHVLQKFNLTKEYAVRDLASDALDPRDATSAQMDTEAQRFDMGHMSHYSSHSSTAPEFELRTWSDGQYHRLDTSEHDGAASNLLAASSPVTEPPASPDASERKILTPTAPPIDAGALLTESQRAELSRMGLL